MAKRTVFIYDTCGENSPTFFVRDGDYSHLDKIYINCCYGEDQNKEQELSSILEEGLEAFDDFPLDEVINGAIVITVGFPP